MGQGEYLMGNNTKFLDKKLPRVAGCLPQRGAASTPDQFATEKAARRKAAETEVRV